MLRSTSKQKKELRRIFAVLSFKVWAWETFPSSVHSNGPGSVGSWISTRPPGILEKSKKWQSSDTKHLTSTFLILTFSKRVLFCWHFFECVNMKKRVNVSLFSRASWLGSSQGQRSWAEVWSSAITQALVHILMLAHLPCLFMDVRGSDVDKCT